MAFARKRPTAVMVEVAPAEADAEDDPLEEVISLAEAAELAGLSPHTLTQQAKRSRLHAKKVGHTWMTTRHWLELYLADCAKR
jgi:hypothetical protein